MWFLNLPDNDVTRCISAKYAEFYKLGSEHFTLHGKQSFSNFFV